MKKKSASQSAPVRRSLGEGGFFKLRVLLAFVFCLAGALIALGGAGLYLGSSKAQAQPGAGSAAVTANSRNGPDIDPADGISFWHTNEYYVTTSDRSWSTRIGKFQLANPMSTLRNVSARAFVQTGDNVMIGGFMVQGTEPKRVIIRAIGPELTQYGVPDALANPTLELHDGAGALIASKTIIGSIR
jgi:hypothetical protein